MQIPMRTIPGKAIALLLALPVLALAAPDAGSILQQLEARPGGALMAPRLETPQGPTPSAADQGGAVVRVNAFRLEGHSKLSTQTLQAALQGFTGRDLSLTQLQEAAWVIVQTYREAGWLAHALVPPQEIEGGEVRLRVIEARVGRVLIAFPEPRLPREHIQAMAEAHLPPGELLSLRQVDRLLLLLEDMPGITATASFAQGQAPGTTDFRIQLSPDKPFASSVTLDNFGAVSTGRERLSASLSLNNAAGLADLMQVQALRSHGSEYARGAWSLPMGLQGWRAGLHATYMRYHLVGSFAALQASGSARTVGIDVSAPLIRSPQRNLSWQLSTDRKHFHNLALAGAAAAAPATVSQYRLDVVRSSLSGNWFDQLLTPAQNAASLQASWGRVHLADSPNAAADASAAHTAGAFHKIDASYNREQSVNSQLSWYLQGSAQWADRNLDSSEKVYLGGASGVRAYPSNEAGGTIGTTATTGLRWRGDQGYTVAAFADWGRIQVYKTNLDATGKPLSPTNTQILKGYGLTLGWRSAQGHELAATWSRRHGLNPAANLATGADSDGTHTLNRLWLSAALSF